MKTGTLTDETKIPLRWVFLLLSASGSGLIAATAVAVYAARIESRVEFATIRVDALESKDDRVLAYLQRIEERLSRMEGKLER